MDLGVKYDAAIITNDQFRDIINEKQGTFDVKKAMHFLSIIMFSVYIFIEWRRLIESRVVSFTFFKDLLILPDDPYGNSGPRLNEILNK